MYEQPTMDGNRPIGLETLRLTSSNRKAPRPWGHGVHPGDENSAHVEAQDDGLMLSMG